MPRKYTILLAVLLLVLAVVLSFQWENIVSGRSEVGGETAENDLSKARSTQRSKKNLEKGSKEMSSQEAFDRLWVIGELALSSYIVDHTSSDAFLSVLRIKEKEFEQIREVEGLLKLIDYDQASRLFLNFRVKNRDLDQQLGLTFVDDAIVDGAFSRMAELDIEETLVIFEQEQAEIKRVSLAKLLVAEWTKEKPYDALTWWKNYASENSDLVNRVDRDNLFGSSLDRDLYTSLAKVNYNLALQEAASEEDDLVLVNTLIGLVQGLPAEAVIDQIAEQVLELVPESIGLDRGSEGNLYLEQAVALKWLERDMNGALDWYQSQREGSLASDDYFKEEDIQKGLYGRAKFVTKWAYTHPDSFLFWVEGRGNTEHYQQVTNFYYASYYKASRPLHEEAMAFITRQKDSEIRRDLFRNAVMSDVSIRRSLDDILMNPFNKKSDGILSPEIRSYDQGLENLKKSDLPASDKEALTNWLEEERKKHTLGE